MLLFEEEKKEKITYVKAEPTKNILTKETALNNSMIQDDGMLTIRFMQSNRNLLILEKSFEAEINIKKGLLPQTLAVKNLFMNC